jgi:hypothetical protein
LRDKNCKGRRRGERNLSQWRLEEGFDSGIPDQDFSSFPAIRFRISLDFL